MTANSIRYCFANFTLDIGEKRLCDGDRQIQIAPRQFDLLALLVANHGALINKERLFEEVWNGVIVGDEAITQAIKDVRKLLGDSAAAPRFIETIPKRGYRFIAEVMPDGKDVGTSRPLDNHLGLALAGALGGASAGLVGGMGYGLIAGSGNEAAIPILLVMTTITVSVATLGALGLGLGMAAASRIRGADWRFDILGAAIGGFVVGELFHLIASGGFGLLIGQPHEEFTGGVEGALLGAGIASGASLIGGLGAPRRHLVAGGAAGGALAGIAIALLGGKLMAASLAALARDFHGSMLDLGLFGHMASADMMGSASVSGIEGGLLGGAMMAAIALRATRRRAKIT